MYRPFPISTACILEHQGIGATNNSLEHIMFRVTKVNVF